MFVVCVLVCAYLVCHSWEFGVGGFYLGLCAFGGVEVEEGEGEIGLGHDEAVAGVEWESCLAECLLEDASGVAHLVAAGAGKPYVARGTFPFCVEYKLFDERGGAAVLCGGCCRNRSSRISYYGEEYFLSVFGYFAEDAVFHDEAFAADFFVAVFAEQVCAVGEDIEACAVAVVGGYFPVGVSAVDLAVYPGVVVGEYLYACEPQSGEEALVVGVDGLAVVFGQRVYDVCAVHAAGADGDEGAVE